MASVRFADLQSRPTEFLDFTSLTLDELALSQILVCWRYAVSSPLSRCPLRGQGVELFGRTAALLTTPFKLPLAQHVHELNAG
jgi:hypothetical protein